MFQVFFSTFGPRTFRFQNFLKFFFTLFCSGCGLRAFRCFCSSGTFYSTDAIELFGNLEFLVVGDYDGHFENSVRDDENFGD